MANSTQAGDLRNHIEVWISEQETNDMGENVDRMSFSRKVWAAVTPSSGRREDIGLMARARITHRVVCRESALPDVSTDMYFVARGQRLKVEYWYPIFNRRGFMEIFCAEVIE